LHEVAKALEATHGEAAEATIIWKPKLSVPLDDEAGEKLIRMLETLEDSDDVQNVYANFEISDEVMARIGS
ncbi:MAG: YebC/PmpR family DNA-binding transcriptional regulator, partial [Pseudomonadota bacterium]